MQSRYVDEFLSVVRRRSELESASFMDRSKWTRKFKVAHLREIAITFSCAPASGRCRWSRIHGCNNPMSWTQDSAGSMASTLPKEIRGAVAGSGALGQII